jgi:hypothetical protein
MAGFERSNARIKRVCMGVCAHCVREMGHECAALKRGCAKV